MANYACRNCDCTREIYAGHKRPDRCEHGNLFEKVRPDGTTSRSCHGSTGSKEPKRDWTDAQAKVDQEGCCRICKRTDRPLEATHILGREHDEPKVSKQTGEILTELYVDPDRVFPACGPFPEGCHGDAEYRRINVLLYLTLEEQIRAVKDAGGIAPAVMRLAPVEHREEVEASAAPTQTEGALVGSPDERSSEK
jgi:hypothetical protein